MNKEMMTNATVQQENLKYEEAQSVRTSWSQKYSLLSPWFEAIISQIKRDCKTEHLSIDPYFVRAHFSGKPVARISLEEMRSVYLQQILSGHDRLAEFIANRWIFRNMEIYTFFEKSLESQIPGFDQSIELPNEVIQPILMRAITQFGVEPVFCFTVLNDLALPKSLFDFLQKQAFEKASHADNRSFIKVDESEETIQRLQSEIVVLKEKQEKKISELAKKHGQEIRILEKKIETLHHQISNLKNSINT